MKILISDTHFGCRQNSITWLNYQMKFFYEQLIPFIKTIEEPVKLIHLGDVFDSRSSVNILVANQVKQLFEDLCKCCLDGVRVIGGNHDYYSPNESQTNDNSIDLVLGELCYYLPNIHLITKKLYKEDNDLFVPWFRYFDYNLLKNTIENEGVKRVFIHNDLTVTLEDKYKELFKNVTVYSGHIHIPKHDKNLHTLGATFALTFADSNSARGFYTMNDDGSDFTFHSNDKSIKFYRIYNKEVFDEIKDIKKDDYVELYVNQDNLLKDLYVNKIKELNSTVSNIVVIPRVIKELSDDSTDFEKYDIADICRQNIPDNLIEKFNKISLT